MRRCAYDVPADKAVRIDEDGSQTPTEVRLCSWAHDAPDAVKLVDTPVWIQRNAMSGAHMNHGDCEKCSAYKVSQ